MEKSFREVFGGDLGEPRLWPESEEGRLLKIARETPDATVLVEAGADWETSGVAWTHFPPDEMTAAAAAKFFGLA